MDFEICIPLTEILHVITWKNFCFPFVSLTVSSRISHWIVCYVYRNVHELLGHYIIYNSQTIYSQSNTFFLFDKNREIFCFTVYSVQNIFELYVCNKTARTISLHCSNWSATYKLYNETIKLHTR